MVTRAVRNLINNSISRVIPEIKAKVREEINKNVKNLQQELLSPETISKTLITETPKSEGLNVVVKGDILFSSFSNATIPLKI